MNKNDPVHTWFGLTYASYFTMPRSVLQSMPNEWQQRFVSLVEELEAACDAAGIEIAGGEVQIRSRQGRYIDDPLCDYDRGRRNVFAEKTTNSGDMG